ncbi:MAG: transcription antitermination factor NusB [Formosimonas sp.]
MKSARRRSRELAVQGLYQWLVAAGDTGAVDAFVRETPDFHKADEAYYKLLFKGVVAEVDDLRAALTPLIDRPIAELSPVEHGVLLVAAYELRTQLAVPYKVVINEAVEITKSFGGTDGFKYVNGVLDKLAAVERATEIQNAP